MKKLVFDICKAHNNFRAKNLENGSKVSARRFLKKVVAHDYDIRACYWDGVTWHISYSTTGMDFLLDSNQFDSFPQSLQPSL